MLSLLLLPSALAFDTIGAAWSPEDIPVELHLSAELGGGLDETEVQAALEAAMSAWAAPDCAGFSFTLGEPVSGASYGDAQDGQSVIFILDQGWPEEASLLSAPAVFTAGARVVEADIALNAQHFSWSTDGDGVSRFDVQAAFTHELGHALGLWHSSVQEASLNPALNGHPEARSLADDDVAGLCALYDGLGEGLGEQGDVCTEDAECAEPHFCLADGVDRYCTSGCADDGDCLNGYACLPLSDGGGACALDTPGCGGCASGGGFSVSSMAWALLAIGLGRRRRFDVRD